MAANHRDNGACLIFINHNCYFGQPCACILHTGIAYRIQNRFWAGANEDHAQLSAVCRGHSYRCYQTEKGILAGNDISHGRRIYIDFPY